MYFESLRYGNFREILKLLYLTAEKKSNTKVSYYPYKQEKIKHILMIQNKIPETRKSKATNALYLKEFRENFSITLVPDILILFGRSIFLSNKSKIKS